MKSISENEENFRYRFMLDKIFDGFAYHKIVLNQGQPVDYIFVEVNLAFERMMGLGKNDIVGKKVTEIIPTIHEDQFDWIGTYGKVALNGESIQFENYSEALQKWFLIYVFSYERGYFAVVFQDITERKKAEMDLFEEKERLNVTLHSIGDGVITTDIHGNITLVNPIAENLSGWSCEEAIGKPAYEVFHIINEQTRQQCEDPVNKVLETGLIVELENRTVLIAKDGTELHIADSAAPIRDKNGAILGVILVFRDVTEIKMKEREIRYLSYHDKLTGLYNRAFFEDEKRRLDRPEFLPLSLIIGDVNGLKLSNDIFGHTVGDKLLKTISDILVEECRQTDIVARWGGDEFVIILPRTTTNKANALCQKIQKRCSLMPEDPIKPNITLGAASKDEISQDINQVLKEAEDIMYRRKLLEGKSVRSSIINSMEKTLYARSYETEEHAKRIQKLAIKIGHEMGLSGSELDELGLFALLHDIGKIGIPDNILIKPGKLTPEEWQIMMNHPAIGYRITQSAPELAHVADLILYHHERWDGKGYPTGLKGNDIPKLARIISIIDAYDVMTHSRPYKEAISPSEAIDEIRKCSETQFDPTIAEIFICVINRMMKKKKP